MALLRHGADDGTGGVPEGICGECTKEPAVGPCAACELMICGGCGVFSRDPGGVRVICISCARLVADVAARPLRRHRPGLRVVAVLVALAFGAVAMSLL